MRKMDGKTQEWVTTWGADVPDHIIIITMLMITRLKRRKGLMG